MSGWRLAVAVLALTACDRDPYRKWPDDPQTVFPWVYTPEEGLEDWADARFETETWDPSEDLAITAQYLLKAANHRTSAPEEVLAHYDVMRGELPALGAGVRLSFVGDTMWVGDNWSAFLSPSAHLLDGDYREGNLETPVAQSYPTELGALGLYRFNAPIEMLDGLPFDLVQLTNNHTLDADDLGIEETVANVGTRGYAMAGVDGQHTTEVGGLRIAFLAYTWGLNRRDVTSAHELNIVPFGHLDEDIDLSGIGDDVSAARDDGADTVVLLLHWGYEYEYYPDPHYLQLGRQLVELGADVVVGSGPHVLQPPEICEVNDPEVIPGVGTCSVRTEDGRPRRAVILYSLGNFGTAMPTIPCQVGAVATVTVDPDVTGIGWEPVVTLQEPEPSTEPLADHLDDPELAEESARLDAHLGTRWKR